MIFGIGNDIIQCERMEQLRLKFGEDLLKRRKSQEAQKLKVKELLPKGNICLKLLC